MSKLLFEGPSWDMPLIHKIWNVINDIATNKYGLTYPEPQIEVITANQMLHYMSTSGLPFLYNHWSFGKAYEAAHKAYIDGDAGIPYEMIINSDPMICYIMETNTTTMQALVLAHAVVGHGSFYKNNECFKTWTQAETIISYCHFARNYVAECERKYGADSVERIIDAAHALQWVGVDRVARTRNKRESDLESMKEERRKYEESIYNEVWDKTVPKTKRKSDSSTSGSFPWPFPEENVLYFIEKNSPSLEEWEREIVHIIRTIAQYFYPQVQCKLMHEGWATFWHYTIMTDLYEEGYINDACYLEFITNHTAVAHQPQIAKRLPDGSIFPVITRIFNPYALGFDMFRKIRQVCEAPVGKDFEEFPTIVNTNWVETMKEIAELYTDEGFVYQFLSSETVEKFRMIVTEDVDWADYHEMIIKEVQDHSTLKVMRKALSEKYSISTRLPSVEVVDCNMKGDRRLTLRHNPVYGMALQRESMTDTVKYLRVLWGKYPITLETIDDSGITWSHKREHI